jgi:hypothetical protein
MKHLQLGLELDVILLEPPADLHIFSIFFTRNDVSANLKTVYDAGFRTNKNKSGNVHMCDLGQRPTAHSPHSGCHVKQCNVERGVMVWGWS